MKERSLANKIKPGSLIYEAYWGEWIVYGSKIPGSTYMYDIEIGTDTAVELVNPLFPNSNIDGPNNWDGVRTSVFIDWGDGTVEKIYKKKINSGMYNTDSEFKLTHVYDEAITGDKFTITITSAEPFMPIYCTLRRITGEMPEDSYYNTGYGFLSTKAPNSSISRRPFMAEIQKHARTLEYIGPDVCNNWLNASMANEFYSCTALNNLEEGVFKNLIKRVGTWQQCFYGTRALTNFHPYILGEVNNVITHLSYAFYNSGCTKSIGLKKADNLTTVAQMYYGSKIEETEDHFLSDCPKLIDAYRMFLAAENFKRHNTDFLFWAPKLTRTAEMFSQSGIEEANLDCSNMRSLKDLTGMYQNTLLKRIDPNMFRGDFGVDTPDKSITFKRTFASIGYRYPTNAKEYVEVPGNLFSHLAKLTDKLIDRPFESILSGSYIAEIPDGLFDNIFRKTEKYNEARFDLYYILQAINVSKTVKWEDKDHNLAVIPKCLRGCDGINKISYMFDQTNIRYIDPDLFEDAIDMTDASMAFDRVDYYGLFPETILSHQKKIKNYSYFFRDFSYKYYDKSPIDHIIYSQEPEIDITRMFYNTNQYSSLDMYTYQPFHWSARKDMKVTCDSLYIHDAVHLRIQDMLEGRENVTHWGESSIYDNFKKLSVYFHIGVFEKNTFNCKLMLASNVPIDKEYELRVSWSSTYGDNITETFTIGPDSDINNLASHLYKNAGYHCISIKSELPIIPIPEGMNRVVNISGEIPYKSKPNEKFFSVTKPKFVDRFVLAVCDISDIHSLPHNDTGTYYHPDLLKYHRGITKTKFFSIDRNNESNIYANSYGVSPHMLKNMADLTSLEGIADNTNRVFCNKWIPDTLLSTDVDASTLVYTETDNVCDNKTYIRNTKYIQQNSFDKDYNLNGLSSNSFGYALTSIPTGDPNTFLYTTEQYLEFVVRNASGSTIEVTLEELEWIPILPIKVEVFTKDSKYPAVKEINDIAEVITGVSEEAIIRIYSSVPVWLNVHDNIEELFGVIPPCEWNYEFSTLCPNLRRIGEYLLINLTNERFYKTFANLPYLEFFPETLFMYNWRAHDFESCFENDINLIKVGDYIIDDKYKPVNCRNMFAGCTKALVSKNPIGKAIRSYIIMENMFKGCKTYHYRDIFNKNNSADVWIFYENDYAGISGLTGIIKTQLNTNTSVLAYPTAENLLDPNNMPLYHLIPSELPQYIANTPTLKDKVNLVELFKYASQSIADNRLVISYDAAITMSAPISEITKYLPYLHMIEVTVPDDLPEGTYADMIYDGKETYYNERITKPYQFRNTIMVGEFNKLQYIHNDSIRNLDHVYDNTYFQSDMNILDLYPSNMHSVESMRYHLRNANIIININDKLSVCSIPDMSDSYNGVTVDIHPEFFDNMNDSMIHDHISDISYSARFNRMFYNATKQTKPLNILNTYGSKVAPDGAYGMYKGTLIENVPDDMFDNVPQIVTLKEMFSECRRLGNIPAKISHMTGLYDMTYYANYTRILSVPKHYINTRIEGTFDMSYAFQGCDQLIVEDKFIDPSVLAFIVIDHSLENAYSVIGEDDQIFKGLNYDTEYERRSRVISLLDPEYTFTQRIQTTVPDKEVNLRGMIWGRNWIGKTPTNNLVIYWGDKTRTSIVNGRPVEEADLRHVFTEEGTYEIRTLCSDDDIFLKTFDYDRYEHEPGIVTTGILGGFKVSEIGSQLIRARLCREFGFYMEEICEDLIYKCPDVATVETCDSLLSGMANLREIPDKLLDPMINIKQLPGFLSDSYDSRFTKEGAPLLVLRKRLIENLMNLENVDDFIARSRVSEIEEGFFSLQHTAIKDVNSFADNATFLKEVPRNLLEPLIALEDASYMFRQSGITLDESYKDFFKYNNNLKKLDNAFCGVKITKVVPELVQNKPNLTSVQGMLSADFHYYKETTLNIPKEPIYDDIEWEIPEGFLSGCPNITDVAYMAVSRGSCTAYPVGFFDEFVNLTNTSTVFGNTGITKIHEHTLKTQTTTKIDARMMFYGCQVRDTKPPIGSITATVRTEGMLKDCTGYPTEEELFAGVVTDPAEIKSLYRQEFEEFIEYITITVDNFATNLVHIGNAYYVFPIRNQVLEVDWGDGTERLYLTEDIENQQDFERITRHVYEHRGDYIVRIKFGPACSVNIPDFMRISKITGVFGYISDFNNLRWTDTPLILTEIIEGSNFFKRNTHLEHVNFNSMSKLRRVGTDIFNGLNKVTTLYKFLYDCTEFDVEYPDYAPDFNLLPSLKNVSYVFHNTGIRYYDWYKPFETTNNISVYDGTFGYCENLTKTYKLNCTVNNTNTLSAMGVYRGCPNLTTTTHDVFFTENKNKSLLEIILMYAFEGSPISVIEGQTDAETILGKDKWVNIIGEGTKFKINYSFSKTLLSEKQVIQICNNLAGVNAEYLDTAGMFTKTDVHNTTKGDISLNMTVHAKIWDTRYMFNESRMTNIQPNAIKCTNEDMELFNFNKMFYNCYASPDVIEVHEVFDVAHDLVDDFRMTYLSTIGQLVVKLTTGMIDENSLISIPIDDNDYLVRPIPERVPICVYIDDEIYYIKDIPIKIPVTMEYDESIYLVLPLEERK